MSIYVRKIDEFDIRKYAPADAGFDVQAYIDWVMSFSGKGGTYPTNVVHNEDDSLTISWHDTAGYDWDDTVMPNMYGLVQTVPASEYNTLGFIPEDLVSKNFSPKN